MTTVTITLEDSGHGGVLIHQDHGDASTTDQTLAQQLSRCMVSYAESLLASVKEGKIDIMEVMRDGVVPGNALKREQDLAYVRGQLSTLRSMHLSFDKIVVQVSESLLAVAKANQLELGEEDSSKNQASGKD